MRYVALATLTFAAFAPLSAYVYMHVGWSIVTYAFNLGLSAF